MLVKSTSTTLGTESNPKTISQKQSAKLKNAKFVTKKILKEGSLYIMVFLANGKFFQTVVHTIS